MFSAYCEKKTRHGFAGLYFADWLSYQDSNLDRQNQKLQCYHYTIRQSLRAQAAGA